MQIINLPILAAFAGLFVGCVPFLKGLLFGPEAPLGFLRDCLEVRRKISKPASCLAAHSLHIACLTQSFNTTGKCYGLHIARRKIERQGSFCILEGCTSSKVYRWISPASALCRCWGCL